MGMTITEKILAAHAGRDSVRPGENVWVNVDVLMTHDVCGPGTIGVFQQEFGIPAVLWGAKGGNIHMADEYVELDTILQAAKTLLLFVYRWCNQEPGQ